MSELKHRYDRTISAGGTAQAEAELRQFVSFCVGAESYAIDILSVREIKCWTSITYLPNQPDYVRGVLNLRGAIVPVFDLGCRFGRGLTEVTPKHVVIIVTVADRLIGLLVDTVSDILSVRTDSIGPVPDMDGGQPQAYLSGIIRIGETMVVLLSLESLFEPIPAATKAAA